MPNGKQIPTFPDRLTVVCLRLRLSSWIEAKMSIEMWEISNADCYTLKMDAEESSERPITIYLLRFTCWHKVIRQRAWFFLNTSVGTSSSLLTTNFSHFKIRISSELMCFPHKVAADISDTRQHGLTSEEILMQLCPALSTFVYGHEFSVATGIRLFDTSGLLHSSRHDGWWRHFQKT